MKIKYKRTAGGQARILTIEDLFQQNQKEKVINVRCREQADTLTGLAFMYGSPVTFTHKPKGDWLSSREPWVTII